MNTQVTDSVLQAERRARSYWDIDGLATIAQALAVLLAGVWFLYITHFGDWLSRDTRLASGVVLAVLLALDGIRKPGLIGWIKAKITYPRTGYVAPLQLEGSHKGRRINLNALCFAFLLAALWAAAVLVETPWISAAAAILTALALWWNPLREKFVSFDVLGMSCLGLLAAVVLNATRSALHLRRFGFILIALGVLGLIKGIVTLLRYVRRNPVAQA